jgi:hypothetical protein
LEYHQVYHSTSSSDSIVGGDWSVAYRWDQIEADVNAGRAEQGGSPPTNRGNYGLVKGGPWVFYPAADDPDGGELTYFNDGATLDEFVRQSMRKGLGGVFTWVATSDALDWLVHRQVRNRLEF